MNKYNESLQTVLISLADRDINIWNLINLFALIVIIIVLMLIIVFLLSGEIKDDKNKDTKKKINRFFDYI